MISYGDMLDVVEKKEAKNAPQTPPASLVETPKETDKKENNEDIKFTTNNMTDITATTLSATFKMSTVYNQIMVTGLADTIMKWKAYVKISNIFTPEF